MFVGGQYTNVAALYGGVSYDSAALAIFAAFTTPPDAARKALINSFVVAEKANGNWAKISALYFLAAADSQAAGINWINPGGTAITPVSSPTFTTDRGYQGNGTSSYLDTGLAANLTATQNDVSLGAYVNAGTDAATNTQVMGAQITAPTSTGLYLRPRNTGDVISGRVQTSANINTGSVATVMGLSTLDRSVSTTQEGYRNGTQTASVASTSNGVTTTTMFLLASNNSLGAGTGFFNKQVAFAYWGQSLGSTGQANLYTDVLAYLTAVGAN